MSYSKSDIIHDIRALGIGQGDSVVVHSSFRSIGEVDGGADTVIQALMDIILPSGALLFPNLNIPHEFTAANPPRFDLKKDRISKLGVMPELFKFYYAKYFSVHPTHSLMGVGEKALEILKDHAKAGMPCGPGTPWERNASVGGKILLVGVTQKANTTFHCAEESIENTYKLSREVIRGAVILDEKEIVVPSRLHVWGQKTDVSIVNHQLEGLGFLKRGKVGRADTMCLNAKGFLDACLGKMRKDPKHFFV